MRQMGKVIMQLSAAWRRSKVEEQLMKAKEQAAREAGLARVRKPQKTARFLFLLLSTLYQKRLMSAFSQLIKYTYTLTESEGLTFPGIFEDRKSTTSLRPNLFRRRRRAPLQLHV